MSYDEICREFNRIHATYFPRIQSRMRPDGTDCAKMRRYMIKHKSLQNVLFPAITYKVDNNTTFCSIPLISDYATFKKVGPTAVTFITYLDGHGLNALVRGGSRDNQFFFITSHFFDRYMERFLNKTISKIDAIGEFFANNGSFMMISFPTKDNPNNMIGTSNDIVFFSERLTDTISIMRTCVTREQLFDSQTPSAELLDQLGENFDVQRDVLRQYIVNQRNNPFVHAKFF